MEEVRVSLEIAILLKEAGYPQDDERCYFDDNMNIICKCPRYLDVWTWLWKKKGVKIMPRDNGFKIKTKTMTLDYGGYGGKVTDVQDVISTGVDIVVKNNLL